MQTNDEILISVITVTYNSDNSLETTILSVLNQSYPNIEYIIIDGQSTDNTLDIIKRYGNKISHWISEPDTGVYDAMNKGVNLAAGDWIYFLGAGDIMLNVSNKIVSEMSERNTIYYGNVYKLDELKIYSGKFNGFKLAVKNICHQSIFYPSIVFKTYKYNVKYKLQADHDLNMRCYGNKLLIFEYLPIIIGIYEGNGLSAANLDFPFFDDKLNIIKSNFSFWIYCYALIRNKVATVLKLKRYV